MLTLHLSRSRSPLSRGGRWRWKLIAANNRTIGNGGEGYHNEEDARSGALLTIGGILQVDAHNQLYVKRLYDEVAYRVEGKPVAGEDTRLVVEDELPIVIPPPHIPGD